MIIYVSDNSLCFQVQGDDEGDAVIYSVLMVSSSPAATVNPSNPQ